MTQLSLWAGIKAPNSGEARTKLLPGVLFFNQTMALYSDLVRYKYEECEMIPEVMINNIMIEPGIERERTIRKIRVCVSGFLNNIKIPKTASNEQIMYIPARKRRCSANGR